MKTEHEEQKLVCKYLDLKKKLYFSVPNGFLAGGRNKFAGINKLKKEGYKNGVPDLFVCEPNSLYHGLFIEMKREKKGMLSADQEKWRQELLSKKYMSVVAHGFNEAKELIDEYLQRI